jgi:outer membrane lipoprotein-sorting protein
MIGDPFQLKLMRLSILPCCLCLLSVLRADPPTTLGAASDSKGIDYKARNQDPRARELLDEAKARLMGISSLTVDVGYGLPDIHFDLSEEITLERPNRFKLVSISGMMQDIRKQEVVCDGESVTDLRHATPDKSIVFDKKLRSESFFLGVNPMVQFFFDTKGIAFDPGGSLWGRPVSTFDTNQAAYDRDVKLTYLGARTLGGQSFEVVEIKYNTKRTDIRQQVYIGADKFVYEVVTYVQDIGAPSQVGIKFRNYRVNPALPEATWHKEMPPLAPVIQTDPVRLGEEAPDFHLPGYNGGEFTFKDLIEGKKGVLVCVIDGGVGKILGPDYNLKQMQAIQQIKDKFEKEGLGIVCIVGGLDVTPDVTREMRLNWMPNVSRFNYPIVIDVDIERGIQGSAYENFQYQGRNTLLLDGKGRVVFASRSFEDALNNLAFYQALADIGFAVSPADLESSAKLP